MNKPSFPLCQTAKEKAYCRDCAGKFLYKSLFMSLLLALLACTNTVQTKNKLGQMTDTEDLWSTAEKEDEARDIDWDNMDGLDEEMAAYEEAEDGQRDSDTEDLWSTAQKEDEARDIDWDSMDGLDEEIVAYEEAERQRIEREAEYLEIGIKIEKSEAVIEENIGVGDETSTRHTNQSELDSTSRVDWEGFTANQKRILRNNIPSGYPIKNRGVASHFGMRDDPIDKAKDFHGGIDLKAEINTAIFAPANGIISNVDYSALNGNWIVVSHKFEFETYYLHLEKSQVRLGDMIHKGDLIGYSGESGRVTGPHLHYEIRYHDKKINPLPFLTWEFGTHEIFTQVKGIKWHYLIKLIND